MLNSLLRNARDEVAATGTISARTAARLFNLCYDVDALEARLREQTAALRDTQPMLPLAA